MHATKNKSEQQILLTGFRATGKTFVGKILAQLSNFRFLDTNQDALPQRPKGKG